MTVVALVPDLMDRSRLTAAAAGPIRFARSVADVPVDADLVIVDLARVSDLAGVRAAAPHSRVIAFGPHVDEATMERARALGIDRVLPRSQFFRRLDELLGG